MRVLGIVLYLIYTSNIPQSKQDTKSIFADDIAIRAVGKEREGSSNKLQTSVNPIKNWTKRWLKENKWVYININNKSEQKIPISS